MHALSVVPAEVESPTHKGEHRLRARRLRVEDLKLGRVVARVRLDELTFEAEVEDLSSFGVALIVQSATLAKLLILAGDRLPSLAVECTAGILYEGPGVVRRIAERNEHVVLGVELAGGGVNLAELYRHGARLSFVERLQAAEAALQYESISSDFKAYVADLRVYLEAMRKLLDDEEKALVDEDQLTREEALQEYLTEAATQITARINATAEELNRLVAQLSDSQHAIHRAFARTHIMPLFLESPFMRRAYTKPLGYAGDYEMMNMLYRDHAEGDSLFAKALNIYATQEGAARANINRIEYLCGEVRALARTSPRSRVRIASVGCGPTRELWQLLQDSPELGSRLDVALIDQEERSIAFCERTLGPLAVRTGARTDFIRESIRRLLTARKLSMTLGQRELIYSAGLFDYLSNASFQRLLGTLYEALVPGGLLIVGNVADHNPSRWRMEYYLDWFLIHRSADELRALASSLQPAPASVEVVSEPTGINLFLRIVR